MNMLYAPWREEYAEQVSEGIHKETSTKDSCVFCNQVADTKDEQYLILGRYKHNFIIINKYPYNAGHLLVIPFAHIKSLSDLSQEARNELMQLTSQATAILEKELSSEGTNIGLNLGKAAGAGIPAHLHLHILPRWNGDTNFLPTIAEVKQVSFDLTKIYQKLLPHFKNLS